MYILTSDVYCYFSSSATTTTTTTTSPTTARMNHSTLPTKTTAIDTATTKTNTSGSTSKYSTFPSSAISTSPLARTTAINTATTKTNTSGSTSKYSTFPSSEISTSPLPSAKDDHKNILVHYLAAGIVVLIVIGMSNLYSFLIATFKCFQGHFWCKRQPLSCWK